MNEDTLQQKIQKGVLEKVRAHRVRVRSRAYFIIRATAVVFVSLLVLAFSSLVLSFIAFSVHESGEQFLLGFGAQGVAVFLGLFPWLPLCIDLLLIVLLEWLLQGFRWGYRFSLATLFAVAFACSVVLALVINATPLHSALLDRADRGELPVVGNLYESIRNSHEPQGIFRGVVASTSDGEILIAHDDGDHDADDGERTVMLPPGTPPPHVGQRVYVFGNSAGQQQVQAYGVEPLSPDQ